MWYGICAVFFMSTTCFSPGIIDLQEVGTTFCIVPFSCFLERDEALRPNAFPLSRVLVATSLYFLGYLMSAVVDKACDDVSTKEFIINCMVQGAGWWIALGENLSHANHSNFHMQQRSKVVALALVYLTTNSAEFLNCIKAFKEHRLRSYVASWALSGKICRALIKGLPQSVYILNLPLTGRN